MILPRLLARLRRRGQAVPEALAADTGRLGIEAQRLLDDPLFRLAVDVLDDEIIERWKLTALGDRRGREELYRLHSAVREVEARLRAFVGDANAVAAEEAMRAEPERDRWVA